MANIKFLRIPLYNMAKIDSVESYNGPSTAELEYYKEDFERDELSGLVEAVKWSTENPDYDFKSLVPDLTFSNKEIYQYLTKVNNSFRENISI